MILPFREWRRLRRRALAAQQKDQSEVCGLIGLNGEWLRLRFMKNLGEPGTWLLETDAIEKEERQMASEGTKILGTFHSHPVSEAIPGPSDIEAMVFGEGYQLIYDVCGCEARLWRRGKGDMVVEASLAIDKTPDHLTELD